MGGINLNPLRLTIKGRENLTNIPKKPKALTTEEVRNYSDRLRYVVARRLEYYTEVTNAAEQCLKGGSSYIPARYSESNNEDQHGVETNNEDPLIKHTQSIALRAKELRAQTEKLIEIIQKNRPID